MKTEALFEVMVLDFSIHEELPGSLSGRVLLQRMIGPSLLMATLSVCCLAQDIQREVDPVSPWIPLFDGQSATEWRGLHGRNIPESWQVENGWLRTSDHLFPGPDLISRRTFSDFEFRFEYKLSPWGNSGVKYLIQEDLPDPNLRRLFRFSAAAFLLLLLFLALLYRKVTRSPSRGPLGYIVMLLVLFLTLCALAMTLYSLQPGEGSTGLEFQLIRKLDRKSASPVYSTGALYGLFPPDLHPDPAIGEPRRGLIRVCGRQVEHWLDTQLILSYELGSEGFERALASSKFRDLRELSEKRPGHLSLQDHGDQVWFRNLKIRILTANDCAIPSVSGAKGS